MFSNVFVSVFSMLTIGDITNYSHGYNRTHTILPINIKFPCLPASASGSIDPSWQVRWRNYVSSYSGESSLWGFPEPWGSMTLDELGVEAFRRGSRVELRAV